MILTTLRCVPELLEKDLSDKKYLITGSNSGVGRATAAQLVKQGAHVIMGCRRVEAGEEAAKALEGPGSTEVVRLDLGDLSSVRTCAETVLEKHDFLSGLVNNAGIMATPYGFTKDGFEQQFGVNHLGHFLLTELLLDLLKKSAPSRIVCVSSVVHAGSPKSRPTIDLDDLKWEKKEYDRGAAYSASKLANVLYAKTLAKKLEGTGVTAVSLHPGWVRSNLAATVFPLWVQNIALRPFAPFLGLISIEDGAQTSLHCILDDDVPNHAGEYYSQNSVLYSDGLKAGGWPLKSPNPNAHDDELAEKLYAESLKLVGLD